MQPPPTNTSTAPEAAHGHESHLSGHADWPPTRDADRIEVLIIDDDPLDRELFEDYLDEYGYSVTMRPSVEDALTGDLTGLGVVLLDLGLPGMRGIEAVTAIRAAVPTVPIVVLTGDPRADTPEAVIDAGAQDFVPKRQARELLDRVIRQAIRRSAFTTETSLAALHDGLTGLPNRSLFSDRLSTAVAVAGRSGGLIGVLYLDLDGFKPVNDRYGHDAGDRLLTEVSRRLVEVVRAHDTVARVGGDEFVILVAGATDERAVDEVAHRVLDAVRKPWSDPVAGDVVVDLTVGVATARGELAEPALLVGEADRACMLGKVDGRGRVRWARTLDFDDSLELLRPGGWLEVHYQPVVDLQARTIAWEALVRLVDRHGGESMPGAFLNRLQAAGYGSHVDLFVLRQATHDAGMARIGPLCVNLSRETLLNDDALEQCLACIDLATVPVTVEVSELILDTDERVARSLQRLRAAGARIALDDFGRGSADLVTMIELAFDVVKIDRSLIEGLGASGRGQSIVRAIVKAAHAVDATVIAEGIEDEAQRTRLAALGIDGWQGFLHARPGHIDDVRAVIDA